MAWISEPNVYGVTETRQHWLNVIPGAAIEYRTRDDALDYYLFETSAWGRRLARLRTPRKRPTRTSAGTSCTHNCGDAHDA